MSARRDWTHASLALRGDAERRDDAPGDPHALRVVALCLAGFWAVVGTSCVAWVWGGVMTWATVITLAVVAVVRLVVTFEGNRNATEHALGLSAAVWFAACAYAMWDRYLP